MKAMYKSWLKAAIIRAIRTFAESALAYIGTGAVGITEVDWLGVVSAGAFGFVTSLLLAVATGLPEVEQPKGERTEPPDADNIAANE
ncbi:MAG: hypothetical protein IJ188_08415 [Clostridia bacterium]|nr:hypothetical protein [Clostridia bacterium]